MLVDLTRSVCSRLRRHRDAWQNVGQVLDSKANLSSYCQEVMRQLGLHYEAPRLPVDMTYRKAVETSPSSESQDDQGSNFENSSYYEALTKEFQSVARNKHRITTS